MREAAPSPPRSVGSAGDHELRAALEAATKVTHITTAARRPVFFDDTDRLLLVEPVYTKTYWVM